MWALWKYWQDRAGRRQPEFATARPDEPADAGDGMAQRHAGTTLGRPAVRFASGGRALLLARLITRLQADRQGLDFRGLEIQRAAQMAQVDTPDALLPDGRRLVIRPDPGRPKYNGSTTDAQQRLTG
ncbi:hypothetical protein D3C84_1074420 [compost metagenome]